MRIGIEACGGGAHYWTRTLGKFTHKQQVSDTSAEPKDKLENNCLTFLE